MGRGVPMRFKRVAEAFDIAVSERLCESSGSEHSPEDTMNLSDLVDSFIENETRAPNPRNKREDFDVEKNNESDECDRVSSDSDLKDTLRDLFGYDEKFDDLKQNLVSEIEEAYRFLGDVSSPGFKRRLMTRLREKGFDTGLCKSKWDKNGNIPAGSNEYVDVDLAGTRHIIEIHLAGQFEIARPTDSYSSLLQIFPPIFMGKLEDFKRIVRLMCTAIRHSMKSMEMALPPWRRNGYMHAKWFGSYKRTTNESPVKTDFDAHDDDLARKRSVGFVLLPMNLTYCRRSFATNVGFKTGQLAMEMNGNSMLL